MELLLAGARGPERGALARLLLALEVRDARALRRHVAAALLELLAHGVRAPGGLRSALLRCAHLRVEVGVGGARGPRCAPGAASSPAPGRGPRAPPRAPAPERCAAPPRARPPPARPAPARPPPSAR